MNISDACPNCCRRDIEPAASRQRGNRIVHGYQCPGCGATWATARDLTAYSELHARTARQTAGAKTTRSAS